MKRAPVDSVFKNLQGLYSDMEPEGLPAEFLTYSLNTQWINKYTIGKRNGIKKVIWLGDGFLKAHNPDNPITKAKVLSWGVFNARNSNQLYYIVALQDKSIGANNAGYLYIEIRSTETGDLISSHLLNHTEGGEERNPTPTKAKLVQQLDRVFLADGSLSKAYYLDISVEDNITWELLPLDSTVNAGFFDNDPIVDVATYSRYLFFLGVSGQAYFNEGIRDQLDFTLGNGGYVEYNATNGLVAQDLQASFLGLLIMSENKPLNIVGSDLMTGTVPYDITLPATESKGFDVKNLSFDISYIPGSTQNIDNNIYGLTQSGVVDLVTFIRNGAVAYNGSIDRNLQLEETLSYPIDDYIRKLDFASENIFSCYDPRRRRYYFSVPEQGRVTCRTIYVYDYKYKVDVPRWSIWKLKLPSIAGMYSVLGKAYVADGNGELYELENGDKDHETEFRGEFELAAVGGDSFMNEKAWNSMALILKTKADEEGSKKYFNIFPIADEFLQVKNNYDENTKGAELNPLSKFPATFNELYYFGRNRTFNDGGFGAELFYRNDIIYNSRTLRIAVEEKIIDGVSAGPWTFKMAGVTGEIDSLSNQE